jgi:hypothetical protein
MCNEAEGELRWAVLRHGAEPRNISKENLSLEGSDALLDRADWNMPS